MCGFDPRTTWGTGQGRAGSAFGAERRRADREATGGRQRLRGSRMPPLFGPPPRPREAARSFSAPALPAGKRGTRGKPGELRVERELRGLAPGSARPGPRAAGARARMLRPAPALPGAPRPWLCPEPPPPFAHTAGCYPGRISEVQGSSLSSPEPRRRKYVGPGASAERELSTSDVSREPNCYLKLLPLYNLLGFPLLE